MKGILSLMVFYSFICGMISTNHSRNRRHLVFPKGSKFFIRINVRENLFTFTPNFAQASGFKMTWELPDHPQRKHKIQKRELLDGFKELLDKTNISGEDCLRKFHGELRILDRKSDVISQLLSIIFSDPDGTITESLDSTCPISIHDLLPI